MKAKYEPKKTRGTDTPNHRAMMAMRVGKGTAPDDFSPQMKKLRKKKMPKTKPGQPKAVSRVAFFHACPLNDL